MRNRKLHIATLWNAFNYGAYLQAYALKTYCEKLGFEVSFLRECTEKRTYLAEISSDFSKMLYQFRLHRNYIKSQNIFNISESDDPSLVTIVGADEIWNVNNPYFSHLDLYIGKGTNSDFNIAYAACCNGADAIDFEGEYGDSPFSSLSKISVRDRSTQNLVKAIVPEMECPIVLDPTFLLPDYKDILEEIVVKPYIFIYGYSFDNKSINDIIKFAKEKRLITISAGAYHGWTDMQIPAGPGLFLGLIKNANFVVTSTFHGSVFSILFNKQFASYCGDNLKIIELLEDFNLINRNASQYDLCGVLMEVIDYNTVNMILHEKRFISEKYIQESLNLYK